LQKKIFNRLEEESPCLIDNYLVQPVDSEGVAWHFEGGLRREIGEVFEPIFKL
jgi:hypothetical protein